MAGDLILKCVCVCVLQVLFKLAGMQSCERDMYAECAKRSVILQTSKREREREKGRERGRGRVCVYKIKLAHFALSVDA